MARWISTQHAPPLPVFRTAPETFCLLERRPRLHLPLQKCLPWLANGARPDVRGHRYLKSKSALMEASESGHNEVCRLLLAHGANVNAKGPGEETALHIALTIAFHEICRLLLDKGAERELFTNGPDYMKPVDRARHSEKPDVYLLFVERMMQLRGESEAVQQAMGEVQKFFFSYSLEKMMTPSLDPCRPIAAFSTGFIAPL